MSNETRKPFPLRFRDKDSQFGITKDTLEKMGEHLSMDATSTIHYALARLAMQILPAYEADDGPLTEAQLKNVRDAAGPQKLGTKVSSLIR